MGGFLSLSAHNIFKQEKSVSFYGLAPANMFLSCALRKVHIPVIVHLLWQIRPCSLQRFRAVCAVNHNVHVNSNGPSLHTSNVLEVGFSVPRHTQPSGTWDSPDCRVACGTGSGRGTL